MSKMVQDRDMTTKQHHSM